MREIGIRFAIALALALAASPALAAERVSARIAALRAEAAALKAKGDAPAALARARAALAIAEKEPGANGANLYEALDALSEYVPDVDMEQQFALYDRMVPIAARAKGPQSYAALSILAGRNVLAIITGKPGASIPAFADALDRATPLASTAKERAQMTGLAMVLAQLYDATGQHPKAVAIVDGAGRFYETLPTPPNGSFAPGLMSLALRYAEWQDWPKAMAAADRAIEASVAFHGRRVVELASALKVRGNGFIATGRFDDAEVAFRDAVALADGDPDIGVTSSSLFNLARLYMATGRDALAAPLMLRITDMLRDGGPKQSNTRMIAFLDLYNIANRAGDYPLALRYALAARADADARGFAASPTYVGILLAVANAAKLNKDLPSAISAIDVAQALAPKVFAPNSARYADIAFARAGVAMDRGEIDRGIELIQSALAIWEKSPSGEIQHIPSARAVLARAQLKKGDRLAAWRTSRAGATDASNAIVGRAGRAGVTLTDLASSAVFDSSIDIAWQQRPGGR